ncbi:hypothetical protein TESS_TESS_02520 [Tessaracoccus sp. O5.2]|uniref:MFS transporter n=1 Tax=Tessaracoccus sp. O5.2 TaxID=3157622 RepID=UPI0035F0EB02
MTPDRVPDADLRRVLGSLVAPVYAPTLAQAIGMTASLPVIPLIALELGFTVPAAAAITMVAGIAGVLGPIPLGAMMTVVGERRAMIATGVLVTLTQLGALAVVGAAYDDGPGHWHRAAFVASLVVSSLAREVWVIGRQAYLGGVLPPRLRARGMSTFGGMMRIGQVLGPLAGAGVIALGHEGWVLGLDAAAMAVATVLVATSMLPQDRGAVRPTVRQATGRLAPVPSPQAPELTAGRGMLLAGMVTVPLAMSRVARPLILPLLGASLGLNAAQISMVFAVAAVVEIAMFVPAGSLMDRYGRTAVLVPCLLLSGAGYVLLAVLTATVGSARSTALLVLVASAALVALGNGFGAGIVMTLGIDLSPERDRTRHLARWTTINGAGLLMAPGLVALVTLAWPLTVAGALVGGLCWAAAGWAVRVMPRLTPRPPRGPFAVRQ